MAFWGIEVKPGKPFTHIFDGLKGRLHMAMATLGAGTAKGKSTLQCNVGNKSPIYLCSLFPEKAESLQINVEFEEAEEVVFSVLGPRSVHLSGHYLVRQPRHSIDDNSESYGEDIADSETRISINSEEDEYEDSFIDDEDPEVLPSSPVSDGEDSDYGEQVADKKKPRKGSRSRRLRKVYVSESEMESEDEDLHPISSLYKQKSTRKDTEEQVEEKFDKRTNDTRNKKTEDGPFNATESIKDVHDVDADSQWERKFDLPVEPMPLSSGVNPEVGGRPKRKRKYLRKEEKPVEADVLGTQKDEGITENGTQNYAVEGGQEQNVANHSGAEVPDNISKRSTEVSPENGERPKKRKKKRVEGKIDGVVSSNHANIVKEDVGNGCMSLAEPVGREQNEKSAKDGSGAEVPDNISKPSIEVTPDKGEIPKKREKKRVEGKTDGVVSSNHGNIEDVANGGLSLAESVGNEQNQKSCKDGSSEHDSHRFVDGQSDEKKCRKKKKSKTPAHVEAANNLLLLSEKHNADAKSSQVKTLPSGISIEELEIGKPDGKLAISGKKVSVSYVGKLKENGKVIDTNVGTAPFKFRLGKGKVMDSWDIGIDGMRVGDKRRLVIPPSMGFGNSSAGKDIPPNSWLVYDVELVKVH